VDDYEDDNYEEDNYEEEFEENEDIKDEFKASGSIPKQEKSDEKGFKFGDFKPQQ